MYTFGFKLAEVTKQNDAASVGLLALAIKDSGKTSTQLSYQEFKDVIQNQLPARLEKAKISNSNQVVSQMLQFLNQNQSVFTMMAQ